MVRMCQPVCLCLNKFVCGAEYSSKQFSLCFAGLVSALNFNDTSIKIGADVSQLAESQVEESEKSRVSKIECTLPAEKWLKSKVYMQQWNTRMTTIYCKHITCKKICFDVINKKTLQQTDSRLMDRFFVSWSSDNKIIKETYGFFFSSTDST